MTIFEYGDPAASAVLIQPADEHDLSMIESEIKEIERSTEDPFRIIAVRIDDWNSDLSPWEAPAVFGNDNFGSGAAATLEKVLKLCEDRTKTYIIGGYSLAGLFALWTAYQTDAFAGVAAASPSVWFPGFTNYMKAGEIKTRAVYLSLGDKEAKTRNPVMATVADCITEACELLKEKKIRCTLEWNSGNHFKEPDLRTAKAFAWVLKNFMSQDPQNL